MAKEASKFKVGLFVSIGMLIGMAAIIVFGATKFFLDTRTYVTYFEESVQGLEPDSMVRYRGVPIGRVYKIRIAPDGRLVEVQMKIDAKVKIDYDMRVRIKMAGLTGMKYLEIDRKEPDKADLTPEITFHKTLRIIPSNPSEVQEILLGIENVFTKLNQLDMQQLEQKIHTSLDSLQVILSDKRLEATMANLEDTTASWRRASKRIDDMLQGPGVKDILVHAASTLNSLKEISADLSQSIEELHLSERLKTSTNKFDFLMDDARLTSEEIRRILTQQEDNISLILENLRTAAESLNNLAASLRDNPAQLLFAQPPEQKR